jgi:Zn-dependent peptidase ImmA (M78 family)/transcriptional regulator with XRE-family HTH domain
MVEAFVKPALVKWARGRERLTLERAAQLINVKPDRWDSWERGIARPTFRQAQNLAHKLNVPFGYLFLSAPPSEVLPLPDLRTIANRPPASPSPELFDLLQDVLRKQEWYREYQENERASPVPFIGRYSLSDDPNRIAANIRDTLGVNEEVRHKARTWQDFLRLLIRQAEDAGVLVLRSGVVGNNPHRKLDVDEFRGFAISDDLAPLAFINAQDWKTAQIFTLVHEVAHLWIGESGISNLDYRRRSSQQQNRIDRLCDQVAAETLVPSDDFVPRWVDENTVEENLQALATRYRVSQFVVLRRAYENDKLTSAQYWSCYDQLEAKVTGRGTQGGGNFYANLLARNSRTFTFALLEATAEGRVPYRDAARLLNIKLKTFDSAYDHLLAGGLADA